MNNPRPSSVRILIQGQRACFRRPEFVDDFITYDVMPPTVIRRILSSVLGGLVGEWQIISLEVLNPIDFAWDDVATARGPRRVLHLVDVAYVVEATRSIQIGEETLPHPVGGGVHLGLMDYPGSIEIIAPDHRPISLLVGTGRIDLGWMLFQTGFGKRDRFFRPALIDGLMTVDTVEELMLAS